MAELKASWPLGEIAGEVVVALKCVPPISPPSAERTTMFGTPLL